MTKTIRTALAEDSARIAELCEELGYSVAAEDLERRVPMFLESEDDVLLVVEMHSLVVGWGHGFVARRVESGTFAEIATRLIDGHSNGVHERHPNISASSNSGPLIQPASQSLSQRTISPGSWSA